MKAVLLAMPLAILAVSPMAAAQTPLRTTSEPAKPLDVRIEQLPSVLAGTFKYDDYFAPSFLAAVPSAQLKAISEQIITQNGQPLKVIAVEPNGPNSAVIKIEYEKAIASADISIESAPPNKVDRKSRV